MISSAGRSRSQSANTCRTWTKRASGASGSQLPGCFSPPSWSTNSPSALPHQLVAGDRADRLHRAHRAEREVPGVHLDVEQVRAARVARDPIVVVAADRREQVEMVGRVEAPAPIQVHHARELGMVRVGVLDAGRDARGEEAQQVAQVLGAVGGRIGEARVAQLRARLPRASRTARPTGCRPRCGPRDRRSARPCAPRRR